ncbi:MAG: 4Fe-4S binding protein [Candidatus Omnitrophica bacterium]|nr:4Fe-4S binding protein [Candidatus Omnitrophota bacterium]
MAKRKIIKIDDKKCNGCSLCIPNCPEGALQVIDGKARLISDLFCDGLGACIGHCPEGAITIEEREAEAYSETKVMENIVKQGENTIKAHLEHLKEHGEHSLLKEAVEFLKERNFEVPKLGGHMHGHGACPGSKVIDFAKEDKGDSTGPAPKVPSQLRQWPVQIMLVPPNAPYFNGADILIAADCVPFAYGDFHNVLLKGKILLIGCPKLDDVGFYTEKLTQIFKDNDVKSVTCAHMEVPCCFGMVQITKEALKASGKDIPLEEIAIGIKGDKR